MLLRVYIFTYCKHHTTDVPYVQYHATCGSRSSCVDIGKSQLTYLLNILSVKYSIHYVILDAEILVQSVKIIKF